MEAIARRFLAGLEHRTDRLPVANHLWGPGQLLGEIALDQQTDTPERLDRYEARLRAFPAYLDAWAEVARDGIAAGVTSPRVVAERAIAQLERLLALAAEDSPALVPAADDAARERIADVVRDVVNPGVRAFLDVLREYLPHATETIGLSALPDGDAMYAAEVLAWTTLPLDPREVHELGLERFDAIQAERRRDRAPARLRLAEEAIAALRASGADTAEIPEAFLAIVEDQVRAELGRGRPRGSGGCPRQNCEVRAVEAFREADMPLAFYNPPTEDGSRPGVYYINTYDLPSRELHSIASVTFHEANPGHHFQIALEQEIAGPADAAPVRRASSPAARSPRAGACTASASPTRWACTSTTGSASACSRTRPCARPG